MAALPFSAFNYSFQGKQLHMYMSPNSNYLLPCKSRPRTRTASDLSCQSHQLLPDPPPSPEDHEEKKRHDVDHQKNISDDKDQKKKKKKKKKKVEKKKEYRSLVHLMYGEAGNFGKALKESLSPRHKKQGDWKDLFLMSFSFAVYVYISQKIVCAYCAWMAML